jgi:Peptidase_C39 like family
VSDGTITGTVSLSMERQKMPEWCWAAVSVSVDRFFRPGSVHTQCELAGSVLTLPCCSSPTPSGACNAPHELNPVLGRLHLLAADPILKPLTFGHVQKEIDAGRPVCVLIKWLDKKGQVSNRGHFIAISGYRVTPAHAQFVSLADPFFGPSEIDYTQFCSPAGGYRSGHGVWFATFLVENEAKS